MSTIGGNCESACIILSSVLPLISRASNGVSVEDETWTEVVAAMEGEEATGEDR